MYLETVQSFRTLILLLAKSFKTVVYRKFDMAVKQEVIVIGIIMNIIMIHNTVKNLVPMYLRYFIPVAAVGIREQTID